MTAVKTPSQQPQSLQQLPRPADQPVVEQKPAVEPPAEEIPPVGIDADQVDSRGISAGANAKGIRAQLETAAGLGATPEQKVDGRLGLFMQAKDSEPPAPSADAIYEAIVSGEAGQSPHARRAMQAVGKAQLELPGVAVDSLAMDYAYFFEACDGNSQQAELSLAQTVQARKALPDVPGYEFGATYVGLLEAQRAGSRGGLSKANEAAQRGFQAISEMAQQNPHATIEQLRADYLSLLDGAGYDVDRAVAQLGKIWGGPQANRD